MSTTLASTFSDFVNAITGIFLSLFQSVLAVFQAILVLGKDIVFTIINLAQSTIALAVGVVGGVVNFAAANIIAIVVLGGAYYFYTTRGAKGGKRRA